MSRKKPEKPKDVKPLYLLVHESHDGWVFHETDLTGVAIVEIFWDKLCKRGVIV